MNKLIKTLLTIEILFFVLLIAKNILSKNGYILSLSFMGEDALHILIFTLFFLFTALLFYFVMMYTKTYRTTKITIFVFACVLSIFSFFFFLFEQSEYNIDYMQITTFEHFMNDDKDDVNLGYFIYEKSSRNFIDKNTEIKAILFEANPIEYNRGIFKDTNIDEVLGFNNGSYHLELDSSFKKMAIHYHVDGHIYYKIYIRYYEIDYNTGKQLYEKARELEVG